VTQGEVRKTVTIVFADLAGSTSLGERLDPESLRQVMSRYFDEMRSVIERHGGTVEKFIGDAVMAVFGVPQLHEDDALRAVRAAAEMRDALVVLNEELERNWGTKLQMRTGVNTGRVVAGDLTAADSLVTGDPVNVAARLEQEAQPGEVLLGNETFRLVSGAVRAEAVPPLELKGKAERVPAYRLLDVTPGAPAFSRRLDSPLVGRAEELATLRAAFDESVAGSRCHLATVVGEAGTGKSRLVAELLDAVTGRARVLVGRCLSYGEGITFWPIAEAIRAGTGITDHDSPDEARAHVARLLQGSEDVDLVLDRVAAAIGLGELGGGELQEMFWAMRRLLEALASPRPMVLVIEDIHWAEPSLLDLIQYLAGFSTGRPILLLCTARPEVRDARPAWEGTTTVTLGPLSAEESGELIDNLLGRAELPAEVRDRIADAGEGNPLFVEEMLRMLVDDGLLVRDDARWRQGADLSSISLPATIHALLSARLDRLSTEERAVIQRAAVVGKVFYWGAVAALSSEDARARVGTHLQTLLRKELVRPDRSAFAGEDALRFSHVLIREAAYESVPKRLRADLHEAFAAWLARAAGDRAAEYEEILGYHLEQSYRYRVALGPVDSAAMDLGRRAAMHLSSAAGRASFRGDLPAAVNLWTRAISLLPEDDPGRRSTLPDLSGALMAVGEWKRSEAVAQEALELARAAGDRRVEAHALVEQAWLWASTDPNFSVKEAIETAERAIRLFTELDDTPGLARAWLLLADMHNMVGHRARMEVAARRVVEYARQAGDRRQESEGSRLLAGAMFWGPTPADSAIAQLEELLAGRESHPMLEVAVMPMLAAVHGMQGAFDRGRLLIAKARRLQEELGLRFLASRMAFGSGSVEMLAGDPNAAEREFRAAYEELMAIGNTGRACSMAARLASALLALGRDDEALAFTERAEQLASEEDADAQIQWRTERARLLAGRGEISLADGLAREALTLADQQDDLWAQADARSALGEILHMAGRSGEAVPLLEETVRLHQAKGNVVLAERTRRFLDQVRPG
jgi:class 3 adenylate cyclase/tetratricopeptide (TPR) repeat protein